MEVYPGSFVVFYISGKMFKMKEIILPILITAISVFHAL